MENSFFPIYFRWEILTIHGNSVSNSWCLVWNGSSLILCKFPSLFSTVKLKLGLSFSQFTLRFELGFFNAGIRLYFEHFPNSRKVEIHEKGGKLVFLFISLGRLCFQISPNSLKSWKIGIFWITQSFIFCQIVSLSSMCKRGGANI